MQEAAELASKTLSQYSIFKLHSNSQDPVMPPPLLPIYLSAVEGGGGGVLCPFLKLCKTWKPIIRTYKESLVSKLGATIWVNLILAGRGARNRIMCVKLPQEEILISSQTLINPSVCLYVRGKGALSKHP